MGVPYKLDIKIAEFIIAQKKSNPGLGCRSFVGLIKDKFGSEISKSTINAVIKESGLSKRVGRPRGFSKREAAQEERKPISFKESPLKSAPVFDLLPAKKLEPEPPQTLQPKEPLPERQEKPIILPEKKIELERKPEAPVELKAEETRETTLPEAPKQEEKPPAKIEQLGQHLNTAKPEFPKLEEKPKEIPKEEKPPKPPVEAKPIEPVRPREIKKEKAQFDIAKLMQPLSVDEEAIIDSMGAFFLKAAELEISPTSILGELVREINGKSDPVDTEIKSNVLLYMPAFGIDSPEALDKYKDTGGLWQLSCAKQRLASSDISDFFTQLKNNPQLFTKLYYDCDKNFKEALYFKFILADGTIFLVDARLKSIWQEPNIPDNFTVTQNKAKKYIDDRFVQMFTKEKQPVILFNAPSYRSFAPVVSEFDLAMEDLPAKRILEITAISVNNQELEAYNNIVPAKRHFIFGFWPWQQEAKDFLKGDIGVVREFYFAELARQIYYSEKSVEFPKQSGTMLSAVFLKNSAFSSPRMGLLTNIPDQAMPTSELIKFYLLNWPNFEDTYQDILSSSERLTYRGFVYPVFDEEAMPKREQVYILPNSAAELKDNLKILLNNLSISAQRHFFPYGYRFADFSAMRERFYSLPGRMKRKDKNLYISLLVPKNYPYSNDLFYAVRRINESNITDSFGYKLWFKVL